jgi:hypothetical protein
MAGGAELAQQVSVGASEPIYLGRAVGPGLRVQPVYLDVSQGDAGVRTVGAGREYAFSDQVGDYVGGGVEQFCRLVEGYFVSGPDASVPLHHCLMYRHAATGFRTKSFLRSSSTGVTLPGLL